MDKAGNRKVTAAVFAAPEAREARIYVARPGPAHANVENALTAILEETERMRGARLHRQQDRTAHRLAHALLQRALRGALGRSSCPLLRDASGCPRLEQPSEKPLWFNLSHTAGMVVCALAQAPVGIDVEGTDRVRDWHGIASRFFHPDELAWIERAPLTERCRRFVTIWTLKEAVVKATGRGLAIPLAGFAVDADGLCPGVQTNDPDLAGAWRLAKRDFPSHHLGLALRSSAVTAVTWTECTAEQIAGLDGAAPTEAVGNRAKGREAVG